MLLLVREVLPLLSPEDQIIFVVYWGSPRTAGFGPSNHQCLERAHSGIPAKQKRLMVILFFVAGIVVFLSYPLWRTLVK